VVLAETIRMVANGLGFWQLRQKSLVTTRASRQIVRHIRRGGEEPWQHGTIDEAERVPLPPRLHEDDRNDVLSLTARGDESHAVPQHTRPVAIEDLAERLAISRNR
jgi:hypothetical protein